MEKFPIILLIITTTLSLAQSMDNLNVAFEWKQIDFHFPNEQARQDAIDNKDFIPENNLPLGLEVYKDRLFITVPRWKNGVAASLAYIKLSDMKDSPKLYPYPNWESHQPRFNEPPQIISPFRIRADKCGRLWVLDTGIIDVLGDTKVLIPRILIYDLHNDALLRTYELPQDQVKTNSFFANLAVEDFDCQNTFAYFGDLGKPALIVYSWLKQTSWRINHNYFHMDPLAGEFNVNGLVFEWSDGLFGLALSKSDSKGFSTLYFHPLASKNEFSINTKYLRNQTIHGTDLNNKFMILGNRGPKSQSGVSFLHQKTDVLFYALVNLNAVACWRITNPNYTMESQGRIYMSNITMVYPNDIKVDSNDNLWVLSNRLPFFMYTKLNLNDVNFRILNATVNDAIKGTTCDLKFVAKPDIISRINSNNNNNRNIYNNNNVDNSLQSNVDRIQAKFSVISIIMMFMTIFNIYR